MTSTEFEQQYASRYGITIEQLRALGRVVVKCKCVEEDCEGWASLSKENADRDMRDMPGLHGYRYPREGE